MRSAGILFAALARALVARPAHAGAAVCDPVGVTPYDAPGVAGSGAIVTLGLGVASGLAAPYGEAGLSMGPTLALIVQELRLVGFGLELVTAPFVGAAGGMAATVEHCATAPLDETAQNEGCVRPHPGP